MIWRLAKSFLLVKILDKSPPPQHTHTFKNYATWLFCHLYSDWMDPSKLNVLYLNLRKMSVVRNGEGSDPSLLPTLPDATCLKYKLHMYTNFCNIQNVNFLRMFICCVFWTGCIVVKLMLILSIWVHGHVTTETSPKDLPTIYIDTLGINITGNAKEDQKAIEKTLRGYIQTVC